MESQACTLGVDIGGTKVAVVVCDERGRVILEDRTPTAVSGGVDPGLVISLELARDVRDRATAKDLDITGIGVGMPEYVDRNGRVTSHEVVDWVTQPKTLFEQLGPTWVESDVRCGALAEATIGAGRELSCFMYVTVGTGIGGGLVVGYMLRPEIGADPEDHLREIEVKIVAPRRRQVDDDLGARVEEGLRGVGDREVDARHQLPHRRGRSPAGRPWQSRPRLPPLRPAPHREGRRPGAGVAARHEGPQRHLHLRRSRQGPHHHAGRHRDGSRRAGRRRKKWRASGV